MGDAWEEDKKLQRTSDLIRLGGWIIMAGFAMMMTYGAFETDIRFMILGAMGIICALIGDMYLFDT